MRTSPTSSLERKEAALCSKYFAPRLLVGRRKERWGFAVLSTKAPSQQLFPCMMWAHSKCWWLLKKDCHPQGDHRWPPGRCPPHDQLNARQILYQFWARWQSFFFLKNTIKWSQVGKVVQVPTAGPHKRILWRKDSNLLCMAWWVSKRALTHYLKSKDFTRAGCCQPPWWGWWSSSTASSPSTTTSALRRCAARRPGSESRYLFQLECKCVKSFVS